MMKSIFFLLIILMVSCSDPMEQKLGESTFESDLTHMVESGVLSDVDARKISCTYYLGVTLEKDMKSRSFSEILSSFVDSEDPLGFDMLTKSYIKYKLDRAISCEMLQVKRKHLRGRVYFGFKLTNEGTDQVVAYKGVITILDVFGKIIYTGPFENQRKFIDPKKGRELWVKLDKTNSDIKLAMKDVKYDFKWESKVVIYKGGTFLKYDESELEATTEFEKELKALANNTTGADR